MSTAFTVVIPARYASSRLPGKPLQDIAGKPMVQHVWEQACKSGAQRVVVATDDMRIVEACREFGAEVLMTRVEHNSGTDRLAEVAAALGLAPDAIVVNVQGDEPLIPPAIIDQVAANLALNPQAAIATLAEPIDEVAALFNPNVVKVVSDKTGLASTAANCRPMCLTADISVFTRTARSFSTTSSPGALVGWKTANAWSNCARSGMACVSTLPMPCRRRLPGSIPRKTWTEFVVCWGLDARSVRLSGQYLPLAHGRGGVAP